VHRSATIESLDLGNERLPKRVDGSYVCPATAAPALIRNVLVADPNFVATSESRAGQGQRLRHRSEEGPNRLHVERPSGTLLWNNVSRSAFAICCSKRGIEGRDGSHGVVRRSL